MLGALWRPPPPLLALFLSKSWKLIPGRPLRHPLHTTKAGEGQKKKKEDGEKTESRKKTQTCAGGWGIRGRRTQGRPLWLPRVLHPGPGAVCFCSVCHSSLSLPLGVSVLCRVPGWAEPCDYSHPPCLASRALCARKARGTCLLTGVLPRTTGLWVAGSLGLGTTLLSLLRTAQAGGQKSQLHHSKPPGESQPTPPSPGRQLSTPG